MIACPHCDKEYPSQSQVFQHVYHSHGKTKAKRYKQTFKADAPENDTEAEYRIQRMIGE